MPLNYSHPFGGEPAAGSTADSTAAQRKPMMGNFAADLMTAVGRFCHAWTGDTLSASGLG